jgi:hypothetical protein
MAATWRSSWVTCKGRSRSGREGPRTLFTLGEGPDTTRPAAELETLLLNFSDRRAFPTAELWSSPGADLSQIRGQRRSTRNTAEASECHPSSEQDEDTSMAKGLAKV